MEELIVEIEASNRMTARQAIEYFKSYEMDRKQKFMILAQLPDDDWILVENYAATEDDET